LNVKVSLISFYKIPIKVNFLERASFREKSKKVWLNVEEVEILRSSQGNRRSITSSHASNVRTVREVS